MKGCLYFSEEGFCWFMRDTYVLVFNYKKFKLQFPYYRQDVKLSNAMHAAIYRKLYDYGEAPYKFA